jgi:predicted benzoate:H+ symporter BenE
VYRLWVSLAWGITGVGLLVMSAASWSFAVASGQVVTVLGQVGLTLGVIGLLVRVGCALSPPDPITTQKRRS